MEVLKPYREKIDRIDDAIVDLLAERMQIIDEVAALKADREIPAVLEDRVAEVRERCAARAAEKGMDPELIRRLYTVLVGWCCETEEQHIRRQRRSA